MKTKNALIRDIWQIINNDEYAWMCVWGPPRTGKSTLCLRLSYEVYKNWDDVLNSVVFNLNGLLYKISRGEPRKFPTVKRGNMRVPLLFIDDFGANCNKAVTRYAKGWDLFKGSFDTLGTVMGVLIANMVKPNEATQQLTEKYTHEIWVHRRGRAKYDTVAQQQDYRRWDSRQKKTWIQEIEFPEVPKWVYDEYNKMRESLAQEAIFNILETISSDSVESILKRIQPFDIELLKIIHAKGQMYKKKLVKLLGGGVKADDAIMRCKAKALIIPDRTHKGYYRYKLTDIGSDIVKSLSSSE